MTKEELMEILSQKKDDIKNVLNIKNVLKSKVTLENWDGNSPIYIYDISLNIIKEYTHPKMIGNILSPINMKTYIAFSNRESAEIYQWLFGLILQEITDKIDESFVDISDFETGDKNVFYCKDTGCEDIGSNNMKLTEIANYIVTNHPDSELRYYVNDKDVDEELLIESLLDFYIHEQMDLCNCGNPEDTYEVIRRYLHIREERRKKSLSTYDDVVKSYEVNLHINCKDSINYGLLQFLMYVLDSNGFTEHGSSIGGSWLTEDGKRLLTVLDAWYEMNNEERIYD